MRDFALPPYEPTLEYARSCDLRDPLAAYREQFHIPRQPHGDPTLYCTGNSLGCQPKGTMAYVQAELQKWAEDGVEGHFSGTFPWKDYHESFARPMARIVGGLPEEVVVMNTLTVNLHLMMVSFYQPTAQRYKIVLEADAFPSDIYAIRSQISWHGYDPTEGMIMLKARAGEHCLRTEDILEVLEQHGAEIALVLLPGVNYYTGQVFEMKTLTQAAHAQGCMVGWDLAHAVGNVPLQLHDWEADFACWCTYKYLNGGPGNVAGAFVHTKHVERQDLPRFAGWWGHDKARRFQMEPEFVPIPTAEGWQLSNPPILALAGLRASMDLFEEVGMERLRQKSVALTGYLRYLLEQANLPLTIITPAAEAAHGCQLSLLTHGPEGKAIFDYLDARGVRCDWREPNVIRTAPTPFYNTFQEQFAFVALLTEAFEVVQTKGNA